MLNSRILKSISLEYYLYLQQGSQSLKREYFKNIFPLGLLEPYSYIISIIFPTLDYLRSNLRCRTSPSKMFLHKKYLSLLKVEYQRLNSRIFKSTSLEYSLNLEQGYQSLKRLLFTNIFPLRLSEPYS